MNIIRQSPSGRVFRCSSCTKIHIEFKNINLNFSASEYDHFRTYINELDTEYWSRANASSPYRRKIILPVGHRNVNLLFDLVEIEDLRYLLNGSILNSSIRNSFRIKVELDSIAARN